MHHTPHSMRAVIATLFLMAFLMLPLPAIAAQSITFNIPDGDVQALIDAINAANGEDTSPGLDIINLAPDSTYTLVEAVDEINGANGLPSITSAITINGNGANIARSAEDDTLDFRILRVSDGGSLTLTVITISNGSAAGSFGGGIFNDGGNVELNGSTLLGNMATFGGGIVNRGGTVSINNTTLSGNIAFADGGAVFNNEGVVTMSNSTLSQNMAAAGGGIANDRGTMTIDHSTFTNNEATFYGGGIANADMLTLDYSTLADNAARDEGGGIVNIGTLTVSYSTLSGNEVLGRGSSSGGGIAQNGGTATINNSTFSNNRATWNGGGIVVNDGKAELSNSTFAVNEAGIAAGIAVYGGTLTIVNSIIANEGANCDRGIRDDGIIYDKGGNISSDDTCDFTATSSQNKVDPLLGPLADNGGATKTHALLPDSPALDAGNSANCLATDQRSVQRSPGVACDVGSYEVSDADRDE